MSDPLTLPCVGDVDLPSAVWMTAGYEYSPGSLSSTNAASHVVPSRESATFNGVRPFGVWL